MDGGGWRLEQASEDGVKVGIGRMSRALEDGIGVGIRGNTSGFGKVGGCWNQAYEDWMTVGISGCFSCFVRRRLASGVREASKCGSRAKIGGNAPGFGRSGCSRNSEVPRPCALQRVRSARRANSLALIH